MKSADNLFDKHRSTAAAVTVYVLIRTVRSSTAQRSHIYAAVVAS